MKIRRFVASDMQEAILKVKAALGSDAIILQTRKFREGGLFGLFGRDLVEVTAAVEDNPPKQAAAPVPAAPRQDDVEKELAQVRCLLARLAEDLEYSLPRSAEYPRHFERYYRALRMNEVEERLARRIVQAALEKVPASSWEDPEGVRAVLKDLVQRKLLQPKPISFKRGGKRRVAFVGPTGVGKTTTIAKLAAIFSILEKRRIALATVDTYRVAAVEQLKTYAEIIDVPLEVAYTPKELRQALEKHADKELVLIDSAGRSPLNEKQMTELKAFLEPDPDLEVFLVLAANTKQQDIWEAVARFSQLPIKRLVFTKLDETQSYGVILNTVSRVKKPLAYVTTGQSVPDDIEVPDVLKLAEMILQVRA